MTKFNRCLIVMALLGFPAAGALAQSSISIHNPRCEYLVNPLGIDVPHPRFSWELASAENGKKQRAFRIAVGTDSLSLAEDRADMWDSGKVKSGCTNQIAYSGETLRANTLYFWKVRVWDEKGKPSAWGPVAHFYVGPLGYDDWKARWIGEAEHPLHPDDSYYPFFGFRSLPAEAANEPRSLTIDLGKEQSFDAVKLYPAYRRERTFPRRFIVQVSSDADFAECETIVDESGGDITVKPAEFYYRELPKPASGRYVRFDIAALSPAGDNGYEYALSEIELLNDRENIALHRPVTASERKFHQYGWQDKFPSDARILTDGHVKPNNLHHIYDTRIPPSPILRKEIEIGRKVRRAFFSASALGIYEAYLNGEKVGENCFAPEFTAYDKHIQYQTYDVSGLIKPGVNVLGAMLADGWYAGPRHLAPGRNNFGTGRRFLGQLAVFYEDGTSETFYTDDTWKMTADSPIREAFFFTGETYDAAKEWPGWDEPGFNDSGWRTPAAYPVSSARGRLCAQMNEPVKVVAELTPISVHKSGRNRYVFDMGQNMVGWCRIRLPYNPGGPIRMRYAEMLYDDGTLYTDNLRDAKPVDVYLPHTETRIDYEPRFTYHGFRYVEVEGLTAPPPPDAVVGRVITSASPVTGYFETSNRDINRLWENIRWTQWGNQVSIPTDCPQRDERLGWMGDAQVFAQNAIYNLDMAAFYTKFIRDIRDSQLEEGPFTDISPFDGLWNLFYNAPGWSDAGVILPWRLYLNYGDTSILEAQYEAMKRFVDFNDRSNPDHIWRNNKGGFGDWLNGDTIIADDYPSSGGALPQLVFSTGYFAHSTEILAKTAEALGRRKDAKHYAALATAIRKAFNDHFVSPDGKIEGDTQAGYAMALHFGLLPEELRTKAAAHMVEAVKAYDYRLSTGFHTTIWMMVQLCDHGYPEVAYRLLTSRRFPSWFYSIDQGATTVWERWDGYVAGRGFQNPLMNSFNHVALGAVGEWMYSHILGIRPDETAPGYRRFYIRPVPGEPLDWARGGYRSINGLIEVAWTKKEGTFALDVTVPPNTEATVVLPDGREHEIESGKHHFESVI